MPAAAVWPRWITEQASQKMVFLEKTSHLFVLDSGAEGAGPDDNLQAMRKFAITVHAQAHERFGKLLPVVLHSHHKNWIMSLSLPHTKWFRIIAGSIYSCYRLYSLNRSHMCIDSHTHYVGCCIWQVHEQWYTSPHRDRLWQSQARTAVAAGIGKHPYVHISATSINPQIEYRCI